VIICSRCRVPLKNQGEVVLWYKPPKGAEVYWFAELVECPECNAAIWGTTSSPKSPEQMHPDQMERRKAVTVPMDAVVPTEPSRMR
jgi:hypothetical protein